MGTTERLTWFGGKEGVVREGDSARLLHLMHPPVGDCLTLCGLSVDEVRPVTRTEANRCGCWCPTCLERGQA